VIVTGTELETTVVLMVKVADVAPAKTVTLDCTVAVVLLDERLIPTPPTAAGPDSVTIPVDLVPPTTEDGDTVTLRTVGAFIVRIAVLDRAPEVAVIVAVELL